MRRTVLLLLSFLACVAWGQTYRYRYWIDNNVSGAVSGSASGEKQLTVSLSSVGYGLHTIHVQGQNTAGVWSSVRTRYFLKEKQDQTCTSARYWIDNDMTTLHNNVATSGIIDLDISGIGNGLHAVHYQTIGADGVPSTVRTRYFLKDQQVALASARYWIDNDMKTMHSNVATSGVIDLDISGIGNGLHAVHYQTIGADGVPSAVRTRYFLIDRVQTGNYSVSISIDNGEATDYALTGEDIVIDIGELSEGEHTLQVTLTDAQGMPLGSNVSTFIVSNRLTGDVNGDGSVDIGDIVTVISVMTGSETAADVVARADVNSDGSVDIGDIVSIIDIMTSMPAAARTFAADYAWQQDLNDYLDAELQGQKLQLMLNNSREYSAFQMSVGLPEGTTIDNVSLNKKRAGKHVVEAIPQGNNQYLIVGYSLNNLPIAGTDGTLLNLITKGGEPASVTVSNVAFATADGRVFRLDGAETTGLNNLFTEEGLNVRIFDLQGRQLGRQAAKGLYIVNGKKTVVK